MPWKLAEHSKDWPPPYGEGRKPDSNVLRQPGLPSAPDGRDLPDEVLSSNFCRHGTDWELLLNRVGLHNCSKYCLRKKCKHTGRCKCRFGFTGFDGEELLDFCKCCKCTAYSDDPADPNNDPNEQCTCAADCACKWQIKYDPKKKLYTLWCPRNLPRGQIEGVSGDKLGSTNR